MIQRVVELLFYSSIFSHRFPRATVPVTVVERVELVEKWRRFISINLVDWKRTVKIAHA